jgi:hypothetical protein
MPENPTGAKRPSADAISRWENEGGATQKLPRLADNPASRVRSAKAWLRVLDGKPVTFVGFERDGHVVVSVDGKPKTIKMAAWLTLPVYSGRIPLRSGDA